MTVDIDRDFDSDTDPVPDGRLRAYPSLVLHYPPDLGGRQEVAYQAVRNISSSFRRLNAKILPTSRATNSFCTITPPGTEYCT